MWISAVTPGLQIPACCPVPCTTKPALSCERCDVPVTTCGVLYGLPGKMAETVLQGRDDGEFDLDLFFFDSDCTSSCQNGLGSSPLISHSLPLMNSDLSSCFPRDSAWGLPSAPSANSLDKVNQGDRSPSDITSIIAHLRNLATETSNNCSRADADKPGPKSSRDTTGNSDSLSVALTTCTATDPGVKDCMDSQLDFQASLVGEVVANQYPFVNVESNFKRKSNAKIYICLECGKTCPCQSAYIRHQRIHTGEKPYACSECGKSFIQISDYNNHVRSHTGEKPYTCAECGKSFSRSTYLVTHSRTHTKEKPYTCNVCGKSFVQHSHLSLHLRIHSGEKPYICIECGNSFSRSSTLVKHKKSHRRKTLHMCKKKNGEDITWNFTQNNPPTWGTEQEGLEDSPSTAEPLLVKSETDETAKCYPQVGSCRKRYRAGKKMTHKPIRILLEKYLVYEGVAGSNTEFSPKKKLLWKKKSQPPCNESEEGTCYTDPEPTICSSENMKNEMKEVDTQKNEVVCSPPKEESGVNESLPPEGRCWPPDTDCTSANDGITKCEVMDPSCSYPNTDVHSSAPDNTSTVCPPQRPHKGSPFICAYCGKSCPCKSAFIRHQRIHTGEKPYTCTECGKSFIQASDYNNHVRSHTGEKPYTCAECGKSFSRSTYLVTHSRTHTKEKPYTCRECGKSFIQHSHLAIHLRIHSGEKPYSCLECGKRFSRSSTLVKHQKSHKKKNTAGEQPKLGETKSLVSSEPSSGGSS
ncbi:zinc finger protein 569-like isoform X2 [Pseudophryne corroboree]|uniref:zinc finger protein 569-like isoform X2 n=1 Tax=Pseudophryne corroboree TaxID=495146 RepID=UPI0030816B30